MERRQALPTLLPALLPTLVTSGADTYYELKKHKRAQTRVYPGIHMRMHTHARADVHVYICVPTKTSHLCMVTYVIEREIESEP